MLEIMRNNNIKIIQKPLIYLDDFIKYTDNGINSLLIFNHVKNKVFKIGNKLFISEKQAIDVLGKYKTKKGLAILQEMHKKQELNDTELNKLYKRNFLKRINILTNRDIDQYICSINFQNIKDYDNKNVYFIGIIGTYTKKIDKEHVNQMLVIFGYTNDIIKYNNQLKSICGPFFNITQIDVVKNMHYVDFLVKKHIKINNLDTDFLIDGIKRDDVVLLDNNFNYFKFWEIINKCIIESDKTDLLNNINMEENNEYHMGYQDGYQDGLQENYKNYCHAIKNKK
jgi:hypothetical protein